MRVSLLLYSMDALWLVIAVYVGVCLIFPMKCNSSSGMFLFLRSQGNVP